MKPIRDLPDTCTTQEIITICEDLQKEGHRVVLEHQGDKIQLYDDNANESYVIEIEDFSSISEAEDFANTFIKKKALKSDKTINIVSRDITVVELGEARV